MSLPIQKRLLYLVGLLGKIIIAIIFLLPFYVAFCYTFKSNIEIAKTGLMFPTSLKLDNFKDAIQSTIDSGMPLYNVICNTLYVTITGTIILTLLSAMCAYSISRRTSKFYTILYSLMVFTLLIPIQAYVFPLYRMLKNLHLLDTLNGFMFAKVGSQLGFSVIITTGFIKTIPREIEEAALVDGASVFKTFGIIILPLLKPILLTTIVINSLNIWNDFSTAFIVLNNPTKYIVTLLQFVFMGTNSIKINLAFALFSMSMVPILILYFILQRYIVTGIVMGSVKG